VKVYGLVGKSGTGKSYQAMNVCREFNIESIIDDGLFICGNSVLAGTSAKRQETKIGAIKTALFTDDAHCSQVREKISEVSADSVLVLGTSEKMILRIAERLVLPDVEQMISIEAVTTAQERVIAKKQRFEKGKHVIPAPTLQLKHDFSGYFLDPMRIFRKKGGKASFSERTVVRPTYSYLGEYTISDKVIGDIVHYIGTQTQGISTVMKVKTNSNPGGVRIDVTIMACYGEQVFDVGKELQKTISERVEAMTAFNILAVNIQIRGYR